MTLVHEPPVELTTPLGSATLDAVDAGALPDADVVAWLSEHLAALERVVQPALRRMLPDRQLLHAQHVRTRELERALRRLHQRTSGDGGAMHLPLDLVRDQVRDRLAAHVHGEQLLEAELRATLTDPEWDELAARYGRVVEAAPTRPHPAAPHSGWTGRLAFGVLARLDRLLDDLDARAVHEPPR